MSSQPGNLDELILQELMALRRDLATLAQRQETVIAAVGAIRVDLNALRAEFARAVERSNREPREGSAGGG